MKQKEQSRSIPNPIYGVTIDSISSIDAIVESLRRLPHFPTVRVVFDEGMPASEYKDEVKKLRKVGYVMGELLDSSAVEDCSLEDYKARTQDYLTTLDGLVDVWEIGNEVNGEWLGTTKDVQDKIEAAYTLVREAGQKIALTLYYNLGDCPHPANEMFTFARNNISQKMRNELDYVFVSYYKDDCKGPAPDWNQTFNQLHTLFPNSQLGFGEVGTKHKNKKEDYINEYYNLKVDAPNFVGGYFWWYFRQDMVPHSKELWAVLSDAFIAEEHQLSHPDSYTIT